MEDIGITDALIFINNVRRNQMVKDGIFIPLYCHVNELDIKQL
ncbi:hypothetical protein [Vallitalea maricola]